MYFGPGKTAALQSPAVLEQLLQGAANSGVVAVRFGSDFGIKDHHIKALVDAMGPRLQSIYLGCSDSGDGVWLTDDAVLAIVRGCPSLRELALCSCVQVSDNAFATVVEGLVQLEVLHCTGHDKRSGSLTNKSLDLLLRGGLPHLRELYLTDQNSLGYTKVEQLLKKRKKLRLQAGETDSDSAAWGCVLAAQGRSYGDGLFGRW